MTEYDKNEIAKLIGRPVRTIEYYSRIGLPDVEPPGRGRAQVYSEMNLVEFAIIEILSQRLARELGLIKAVLEIIRKEVPDFFSNNKWGGTKEVVFLEVIAPSSKKGEGIDDHIRIETVEKGPDGRYPLDEVYAGLNDGVQLSGRVTFLGAVKKEALGLIKRK
jgi:hypothetical protein